MIIGTSISKKRQYDSAFTVAELVTVIVVVAILVLLTIIGISSWRTNVAETEVKNDIASLKAGMEDVRNTTDEFPVFSPGTLFTRTGAAKDVFVQSKNVEATYVLGDETYYCVDFQSLAVDSVSMYLNTTNGNGTAQEGSC